MSAAMSFPATIVDLTPVDADVGAAVSWVLLNSLVKIALILASFRIFASEFKRTQETAAPTSASTGVRSTIVAGKDIAALIAKLDQLSGNALVVAHGNTIPDIVKSLGIDTPVQIPDDDYSELFIVTLGNKRQLLRLHYPQ